MQLRALPLIVGGERIGALVMVRDVTELRRRERELMTKDATIREIHHRVKNNLQTVAALLRLQARRLQNPEGRAALEEAVRRVGSIAIVHEMLSHTPDETVDFDDIADRVIEMAAEVSSTDKAVVGLRRVGNFGMLSALVATRSPWSWQNWCRTRSSTGWSGPGAYRCRNTPSGTSAGTRRRSSKYRTTHHRSRRQRNRATADFDLETSSSLGLQIVRTLVTGELAGRMEMTPQEGGGTKVLLDLPVDHEVQYYKLRQGRSDRCSTGSGTQGAAALERAALVPRSCRPDTAVLAGFKGPSRQAVLTEQRRHTSGFFNLNQCRANCRWEEELGVFVTAGSVVAPVHAGHSSR